MSRFKFDVNLNLDRDLTADLDYYFHDNFYAKASAKNDLGSKNNEYTIEFGLEDFSRAIIDEKAGIRLKKFVGDRKETKAVIFVNFKI